MPAFMRIARMGFGAGMYLCAVACGGGGSVAPSPPPIPPAGANVAAVIVDAGPAGNSVNTLYTSVTVCVPGSTTNCQTIDHIQVDTGSFGLRILSSVIPKLTLPQQMAASGNPLLECTQFVDGYAWGPIELVDMTIASESAKSMPIQVIGDTNYPTVPSDCSSTGPAEDTVAAFGANGIIGIGPFALNCPLCSVQVVPATYYSCATPSTCVGSMAAENIQEPNPITLFATDNNGAIIDMPAVSSGGQANVSGSLIFGIDTQANNASGTQNVLVVDDNAELTMTYNNQMLQQSFIDSGSNGIFFPSNIVPCTGNLSDFYCPGNTLNLTVSVQGLNGVIINNVPFMIGNAVTLLNSNFDAYPTLGGTNPNTQSFDYGLPFFYGRRVAIAVENFKTTVGTGPYIAY